MGWRRMRKKLIMIVLSILVVIIWFTSALESVSKVIANKYYQMKNDTLLVIDNQCYQALDDWIVVTTTFESPELYSLMNIEDHSFNVYIESGNGFEDRILKTKPIVSKYTFLGEKVFKYTQNMQTVSVIWYWSKLPHMNIVFSSDNEKILDYRLPILNKVECPIK
ncbi:hypothetical protein AWQ17_07665 [Vibrio parahaemolyticus]|nr:hypothetical protein AWQ17_07665 [Vibrio parahaemolyticus]